jgi:SH3 domain-containing protein
LTFGDVQMSNDVAAGATFDIVANNYVNVRRAPNTTAAVIAALSPNQSVPAVGRLADNSWLRVDLPESTEPGWVNSSLVQPSGDVNALAVTDAQQLAFRPMQAFYFQSGDSSNQPCSEVPPNGLMVQTPEGSAEVRLWINEVRVDFGSTVFFQATPNGFLIVTTLEGHARVEADGVAHIAYAGSSLEVPLGPDLKPIGPPALPYGYDVSTLQTLPIGLLERAITIHDPLTADELSAALVNEASDLANGGGQICPGQSCDPHGQGNGQGNGAEDCQKQGTSCNGSGGNGGGKP